MTRTGGLARGFGARARLTLVDADLTLVDAGSAPDVACALVVGARSAEQVLANATSMKAKVPPAFWSDAKREQLIATDAAVPPPP